MTRHVRAIGGILVATVVAVTPRPVVAASVSATVAVSVWVGTNCVISTVPLAFGSYDPVGAHASANLDATGAVTIACPTGTATTIGLDGGSNNWGTTRRLSDGTNFLTYEMYKDSGRTSVWRNAGPTRLTPPVAPSSAARSFTVYGRIPANQDVPAGNYADTVTAQVNF